MSDIKNKKTLIKSLAMTPQNSTQNNFIQYTFFYFKHFSLILHIHQTFQVAIRFFTFESEVRSERSSF